MFRKISSLVAMTPNPPSRASTSAHESDFDPVVVISLVPRCRHGAEPPMGIYCVAPILERLQSDWVQ
jgi:hypothetical protein